ncbi:collagen alpha-1(XXIV) chain-like [Bolinopsis microptera]|uniref:collagen alpha-1(XXIV) chain-like n=1 Tax=Bolinopsis microptera TaxID=2820187 RepID=UPI00307AD1ED
MLLFLLSTLLGVLSGEIGKVTLSEHYNARGRTVVITDAAWKLALMSAFDNIMSSYMIEGDEEWEFYDKPNYEGLLFTATGPLGWTDVFYLFNDKVSSIKPVRGEEGPQGEQGVTGEDGVEGEQGDQGAQGTNDLCSFDICSSVGEPGEPGNNGSDGEKGATGNEGETGENGEMGLPGSDGVPGFAGLSVLKGKPGRDGSDGSPGLNAGQYCKPASCGLKLGHCYGMSSVTLTVQCREGYGAASIWKNTRFWGLKCCKIVGTLLN